MRKLEDWNKEGFKYTKEFDITEATEVGIIKFRTSALEIRECLALPITIKIELDDIEETIEYWINDNIGLLEHNKICSGIQYKSMMEMIENDKMIKVRQNTIDTIYDVEQEAGQYKVIKIAEDYTRVMARLVKGGSFIKYGQMFIPINKKEARTLKIIDKDKLETAISNLIKYKTDMKGCLEGVV